MNLQKFRSMGVSFSRLEKFLGCKREFWYTINNWYSPFSPMKKNAYFGNLCHYLLEDDYTEIPGFQLLLDKCRWYDKKNPSQIEGITEQDLEKDKGLAAAIIYNYYVYYGLTSEYKILVKELHLRKIKVRNHTFTAKIDKVLKHCETGKLALLDHKCKSKYDIDKLQKKLYIDMQLMLYDLVFVNVYKKPIHEIIHDIIRKPQLRITAKDENIFNFICRVDEDIQKRPEHYFQRIKVVVDPQLYTDFLHELDDHMNDIYCRLEKGEAGFPKNTCLCLEPYTCQFLDACVSGNMNLYKKYF